MGRSELENMLMPDEKFGNDDEIWIWGTDNTAEMFAEGFHPRFP